MGKPDDLTLYFKYKQIEKEEKFSCPFCGRLLAGKRYIVQLDKGDPRECCTECTENIIQQLEV